MRFKRVIWPVPMTSFQDFNDGKAIMALVPTHWGLQAGDRLQYECGQSIYGIAEVVSIGAGDLQVFDWNAMESGEESPPKTKGTECEFKKIN